MEREREAQPRAVHCKRQRYDVYIGRPSKWGNPFAIGKDGIRNEVISKYREWVQAQPALMAALPELKGKTLGCWCAPQPCHGDVLVELANKRELERAVLPENAQPDHGRAPQMGDPGYAAWREQQRQKDRDRER